MSHSVMTLHEKLHTASAAACRICTKLTTPLLTDVSHGYRAFTVLHTGLLQRRRSFVRSCTVASDPSYTADGERMPAYFSAADHHYDDSALWDPQTAFRMRDQMTRNLLQPRVPACTTVACSQPLQLHASCTSSSSSWSVIFSCMQPATTAACVASSERSPHVAYHPSRDDEDIGADHRSLSHLCMLARTWRLLADRKRSLLRKGLHRQGLFFPLPLQMLPLTNQLPLARWDVMSE